MKENKKLEWICTDDDCAQYCLKHSETKFELVQYTENENEKWLISAAFIDLNDYLKEEHEIQSILRTYGYKSMDDLRKIYGNDANQILAECIFETIALESVIGIAESKEIALGAINEYIGLNLNPDDQSQCSCKMNKHGLMLNREDGTSLQLSETESRKITDFIHRQDLKQQLIAELNEVKRIHVDDRFVSSTEILNNEDLMNAILDFKEDQGEWLEPLTFAASDTIREVDGSLPFSMELSISNKELKVQHRCTLQGSSIESLKAVIDETIQWMCHGTKSTERWHIETVFSEKIDGEIIFADIDSGWFMIDEKGEITYEF